MFVDLKKVSLTQRLSFHHSVADGEVGVGLGMDRVKLYIYIYILGLQCGQFYENSQTMSQ